MLIHISAPVGVGVARKLTHEEVAQEGLKVQIGAPVVLHLVEIALYVAPLLSRYLVFVGRLDGHGIAFLRGEPRFLLIGIGIHLNEVAAGEGLARYVFGCHLGDFHTPRVHFHLVAQLIAALVFAVEHHIDSRAEGCVGHTHAAAKLESQQVAHQRLVAVVVYQGPLLGLCRCIEHVLLLVELDAPRLLRERSRGVSAFADAPRCAEQLGSVVGYDGNLGGDVVLLVVGYHAVKGVYAHGRQVGELAQTALVALAGMTVELHFGNVAARISRTDIPHIAEASRTVDFGMAYLPDGALVGNDIQGHSVHEVFTVCTLEHSQYHASGAQPVVSGRPPHLGDDARLAKVETNPRVAALPRGKECVELAVERLLTGVHGLGRLAATVVY